MHCNDAFTYVQCTDTYIQPSSAGPGLQYKPVRELVNDEEWAVLLDKLPFPQDLLQHMQAEVMTLSLDTTYCSSNDCP